MGGLGLSKDQLCPEWQVGQTLAEQACKNHRGRAAVAVWAQIPEHFDPAIQAVFEVQPELLLNLAGPIGQHTLPGGDFEQVQTGKITHQLIHLWMQGQALKGGEVN